MKDLPALLSTTTLFADGAISTMLHARGVSFEKCFTELGLSNPAVVAAVQPEYIGAGAQIVLTNAFGSNRFRPGLAGLATKGAKIQPAGVEVVWRAEAESLVGRVHA